MNAEKCEAVLREMEKVESAMYGVKATENDHRWVVGNKWTGKLRRASMDLTRALAELRKPS